jgi:microcystin-dependent protein
MSIEDQNHLPIRTITTADTFNDWRRITNSIAESAKSAIETGSHLYLGDYDWTGDVFRATVLPENVTSGTESPIGATWSPENSVTYDSTHGGVRFTLANTSYGNAAESLNQWARIRTRVPIDESATYRIKVRIKNLRTSGENRIYFGAIGLNETFQALRTDAGSGIFNYGVASGVALPNANVNGGVTEFSALIGGFNDADGTDDKKFDPGSKFFDLIYINHYRDTNGTGDEWVDANDDTIIQNIEIERLPSGIIITEHDTQDANPSTKLQVGYSSEYTEGPIQSQIGLAVKQSILVQGGRIIFSDGGGTPDNPNNIDQIYSNDLNNSDNPNSYHFSHDAALDVGSTYGVNKHVSTLRSGRIVMDTQTDDISSLRSKLFIGKSIDYNTESQTPTGLLNLAIGSANATETGAGPAINFYTPDSTATDLQNVTDIKLTDCQLSGQIAVVKSQAVGTSNPEAYGTGDMVFKVAKNADSLKEILRLEPDGQDDSTKVRKVSVGTSSTNTAELDVWGNISRIRNLTYTWPTTRSSPGVTGTSRVLSDDGSGNLAWRTVAAVSQNVTAFVQNETAPLGTIFAWSSGNSVPNGFAECLGQAISTLSGLSESEKSDLRSAIGSDTLPDLQQRVVVGRKPSVTDFEIGDTGGSANITGTTAGHTLTIGQMPAHDHIPNRNTYNTANLLLTRRSDGGGTTGSTDGTVGEVSVANSFGLPEVEGGGGSHSHNINLGANSNYSPYIALTYIMKVKADNIATLDVTLGDNDFNEFTTTGGTLNELGFETTNLRFSDGHPSWSSDGHLYVKGVDLRMNTTPSGAKGVSDRQQGRALVASVNGISINWGSEGDYDFDEVNLRGDKVVALDMSITDINAAGTGRALVTKEYLTSDRGGSHYRSGEVIETFSGPCGIFTNASGTPTDADTHTRTVLSGTYRMPSCGASNSTNMSYRLVTNVGEIFGGVSYKRIAGVKYIYYAFAYNAKPFDNHGIWSHTPVVDSRAANLHVADNTDIPGTGGSATAARSYESGVHVFQNQQNNFEVITVNHDTKLFINEFTVECVDTIEEENIALSKVYWPVGSTYQLSSMIRNEHGTDNEVAIFASQHNRNTTPGTIRFNSPHLTITATAG